jgi:uncharacterized protein (DUF2062 family)
MGSEAVVPVLLGMAVTAGVLAAATYPLVYRLVVWHRRRRADRRARAGRSGGEGPAEPPPDGKESPA